MVYENLTEFERALARFGDKVDMIVGFEVAVMSFDTERF